MALVSPQVVGFSRLIFQAAFLFAFLPCIRPRQGLSLAVDYTYFDEWNRLNIWTGENNDIKEATDKELEYANTKYWNALACEILKWDRANRT